MADTCAARLIIVRHGETEWNRLGLQQGHLDSPLTPLGRQQARAAAAALTESGAAALYSSDLGRALSTAQIIGERLGLQVGLESRLRERHLGILQGLTMARFEQEHPQECARLRSGDPDYTLPQGESARQCSERCVAGLNAIAARHAGETVVIVTHGGVLNRIFRRVLGIPLHTPRRFALCNGSINTFSARDGEWRLETWGEIRHLRRLGTADDW